MTHREPEVWRSRGYIPHYHEPGMVQMITIRLHDSLPAVKLAELNRSKTRLTKLQVRNALEAIYDAGHGECYLRDPRVAALAQGTLLHFDGDRYHLLSWVIMPNHMHVLVRFVKEFPVPRVLHSWKSYIANQGNKLIGRSGHFWQREYFDRFIRNETHFRNAVAYIEGNPVKAGLCRSSEDWPYSSAKLRAVGEVGSPIGSAEQEM